MNNEPSGPVNQDSHLSKTPTSEVPPVPVEQAPKKKKTGLIIGAVVGVSVIILLVATVLLYFLWWQSPKKIVADAVSSTMLAKEMTSEGTLEVDAEGADIDVDFFSSSNKDASKVDMTIKLKVKDLPKAVELKLKGIYMSDGVAYVNVDGIQKAVEDVIDSFFEKAIKERGGELSDSDRARIPAMKEQIMSAIKPYFEKIDGKWLKFTKEYVEKNAGEQSSCWSKAMEEYKKNDSARKELTKAYVNNFPEFKQLDQDRDGAQGFEIDLSDTKTRESFVKLAKELSETKLGKQLAKCEEQQDGGKSYTDENKKKDVIDEDVSAKIRFWVDPFSHQMKHVEMEITDDKDNAKAMASVSLKLGESEKVEAPKDAKDANEINNESSGLELMEYMQEIFSM